MQNIDKIPLWWRWFAWILAGIVFAAGLFVWTTSTTKPFVELLNLYTLFPVLGIWTWSLMWTHFIVGEVRRLNPALPKNMLYSKVSGVIILALLFLHPGLLIIAQYQNGFGLPPASIYAYVAQGSIWAVVLGVIALVIFLSFEIFDRIKEKPQVARNWWLVNISQTVAMYFIFFHALELGGHLQITWFRIYWIILGILLLPCVVHTHLDDWRGRKLPEPDE